jgi:hypothetical protein
VALLAKRVVRVTIIPSKLGDFAAGSDANAIVCEGERIQFHVKKDLTPTPNPCVVTITNLSAATRALLSDRGTRVILEAGYEDGGPILLFSGDATYVDQVRRTADWETKIECGDGMRAFQFARVNFSFSSNTKIDRVIKKVVGGLGVDPGNLQAQADNLEQTYETGYSASGRAADEMNRLTKAAGLEWSIQDGRLQLLRPGETSGDVALDIGPDSGLIGSPEHGTPEKRGDPPILKVRSLLAPTCKPGAIVQIRSEKQNGQFRIKQVEHTGDTRGLDWYTDLEVHAL